MAASTRLRTSRWTERGAWPSEACCAASCALACVGAMALTRIMTSLTLASTVDLISAGVGRGPGTRPCGVAMRRHGMSWSSSRKKSASCAARHERGSTTACAAAHIADTNVPSTPNGVKNVSRLRVRRNGTGSPESRMPFMSNVGWKSSMKMRPVFFAKMSLFGVRPPIKTSAEANPDSASWQQNCFLKHHNKLQVGSVLYMYWLKTFSVT
mmetsp:Transcript_23526/g.76545  ORF Transcript_23526/g.76545 Transcript_23526/m.76545 type:complete len:211 (-) Transcript_23526:2461-3093(-)